MSSTKFKILKSPRKEKPMPQECNDEFYQELEFVKKEAKQIEERDRQLALKLNEEEYAEKGQLIECGCCCYEFAFEQMIQCTEGHLFCCNCLKKYIDETVFGKGQTNLRCMDSVTHCKATFPFSQLQRCLPPIMFSKMMEILQDIEIRKAGLENLEQCPFCDFKMEILDKNDKIFRCQKRITSHFVAKKSNRTMRNNSERHLKRK
jgi:TRIAD3 protein (E3 ubiquitin-protein ligase RNF216)